MSPKLVAERFPLPGLLEASKTSWGGDGAVAFQGALWLFPEDGPSEVSAASLRGWVGWKDYGLDAPDGIFGCDLFGTLLRCREGRVESLDLLAGTWEPEGDCGTWVQHTLAESGEDLGAALAEAHSAAVHPGLRMSVYPPWIFEGSGQSRSYKLVPIRELMDFHADLFRQIRDLPEGASVRIRLT